VHALNRLTFGPRPGDVDRVVSMGVDKWIEQQLHPEKIEDSALDARLSSLRTLRMSTRELVESFPPNQLVKAVANGKQPLPSDPVKRAIYEDRMQRAEARKIRKQDLGSGDRESPRIDERIAGEPKLQNLLERPPEQRLKEVLRMSPDQRLGLFQSLKGGERDAFLEGMTAEQRETLLALNNPQQVVISELVESKLLRATYSERQLDEVMTDFWFNHFNVFAGKGADRYLLTSYE